MELQIWQIILITLLAFFKTVDWSTTQITTLNTVIYGMLTGLILGDMSTGLAIGATMQLMSLGVVAVGGASMPDYPVAAIIATTIAITSGQGMEAGLALGIPVGMLGVQFGVISNIVKGPIARKAQEYANKKQFNKMINITLLSPILSGLTSAIPVLLSITFGKDIITSILEFMPAWFTSGLSIAGGMLPAVGISMLLMYMPTQKYISYLIVGFVLSAYLKIPVLGVALVGFACAYELYKKKIADLSLLESQYQGGENEDE